MLGGHPFAGFKARARSGCGNDNDFPYFHPVRRHPANTFGNSRREAKREAEKFVLLVRIMYTHSCIPECIFYLRRVRMENIFLHSLAFLSFFSVDNSTPHTTSPRRQVFPNRSITRVIFLQRWHIKEKSLNLCASRYVVGGGRAAAGWTLRKAQISSLLLLAFGPSLALHRRDFYVSDIFPSISGVHICTVWKTQKYVNHLMISTHCLPEKKERNLCVVCAT